MKFKYIGLKTDGERAFIEKTGIEWMPAAVHDVTHADVAAQMLQHPTIWQPLDKGVTLADAPKRPLVNFGHVSDEDVLDEAERREKAAREAKPVPTADPLTDLDDAAVKAWAKDKGLKVHGIGLMKGETLRTRVREALK